MWDRAEGQAPPGRAGWTAGRLRQGSGQGGRERMGPCLQSQKNTLFPLIWKSAGKSVFFVAFYEIF